MPTIEFDDAARRTAETLVELAFAEDLGLSVPHLAPSVPSGRITLGFSEPAAHPGDLTSGLLIPGDGKGRARFVARSGGVVAGLPVLRIVAT
ncbi:MAG: hypothetical protein AB7I30_10010, partial [Isosphaeraceae bacterium]